MKFQKLILSIIVYCCIIMIPTEKCLGGNLETGKVYVLCYHSFLGKRKIPTDVSINELKEHIDILKKKGFKFVSFAEILKGKVKGSQNILITIDDGNKSIIDANNKVFIPNGIKPMLGIYPNIIGKKDYALNWEELKKLSDEGFDIASHGYYHLLLNDKLYKEDKKAFHDEILKSQRILKEKLGKDVKVFIYANGVRSEQAKRMLKEAGYDYAFTIIWGDVQLPLNLNRDKLDLHRYMVSRNFDQISTIITKNIK